jgi:hypothetical protein
MFMVCVNWGVTREVMAGVNWSVTWEFMVIYEGILRAMNTLPINRIHHS